MNRKRSVVAICSNRYDARGTWYNIVHNQFNPYHAIVLWHEMATAHADYDGLGAVGGYEQPAAGISAATDGEEQLAESEWDLAVPKWKKSGRATG